MTPDPRLSYIGYTQQQSCWDGETCKMYGGCVSILTGPTCCAFLRLSVSRRSGCCLGCWGWYLARKSGEDCGVWLADWPGDSAGSGGVPASRNHHHLHLQATGSLIESVNFPPEAKLIREM